MGVAVTDDYWRITAWSGTLSLKSFVWAKISQTAVILPLFYAEVRVEGYVHSFESFGTVDGPGIRFVVFMQGCPMRCKYCHNPDTWAFGVGKKYTAEEVAKNVLRYKNYFVGGGGITLSGGEPMAQAAFAQELFALIKKAGVSTALDTSGVLFDANDPHKFDGLLAVTDLVLLDIKHIDDGEHRELTGHSNANVMAFARYLSDIGKDMWIRHVLVPGITDDDGYLKSLSAFIGTLKTVRKIEVLPYHTMGVSKYASLGVDYPLNGVEPPSRERVENAKKILGVTK